MLFKLLFAPVTGPMAGFRFILDQVRTMSEREMSNVTSLNEELLLLQLRLQEGEVTEEEFVAQEADIVVRLRAARELSEGARQ